MVLDSSKLKELADNNFKFDKNGRKLSTRVENTEAKWEIARYEQIPLLPQCCNTQSWVKKKGLKNKVRKRENPSSHYFLLFFTMFLSKPNFFL